MSEKIQSFEELQKRVREKQANMGDEFAKGKNNAGDNPTGDNANDINDPTNQGKKNAPQECGAQNKYSNLPGNAMNYDSENSTGKGSGGEVNNTDSTHKGNKDVPVDQDSKNQHSDLPENQDNKNISKTANELLTKIKQKRGDNDQNAGEKSGQDNEHQHNENVNQDLQSKLASSQEYLAKLGQAVLEVEGGIETAQNVLNKKAGADAATKLIEDAKQANQTIKQASQQEKELDEFMKNASDEEKQELQQMAAYDEFMKNASDEEKQEIEKIASIHKQAKDRLSTEQEKQAYDAGAADAAMAMDAQEGGQMPEDASSYEPSMEEILMILDQLVQAGEIDEQTAVQLAEMLMAEMEGQGGGGAPAPQMPAPQAPASAMEGPKAASAAYAETADLINQLSNKQ